MHRRFICAAAAAFIAGILAASAVPEWMPAAGLITAVAMNIRYRRQRLRMIARSGILLAFFILGMCRFQFQEERMNSMYQIDEEQAVTVQGRIGKKEQKENGYAYELRQASIIDQSGTVIKPGKISVVLQQGNYVHGAVLQVPCQMSYLRTPRNEGGFDQKKYQNSLGISAVLYADYAQIIYEPEKSLKESLFMLRSRIRDFYSEYLNEKDAGLMSAMILGDKSLMEEKISDLYTDAGISHILAVSGLHISFLGMGIYHLLRRLGWGYPAGTAAGGICVCLFCMMSGASISAVRAGIMFVLFLGAELTGRNYDSMCGIGVASLIILMRNPHALWNAGFQFSFLAVLAVVGIGSLISVKKSGIRASVVQNMKSSFAVQLVTLPFSACYYFEIPVYSIPVNILIIPLSGVLMGSGLVSAVAGVLGMPAAWLMLLPCHLILKFYEAVCNVALQLPASVWITGQVSPLWIGIYEMLLIVCVSGIWKKKRKLQIMEQNEPKDRRSNFVLMIYFVPPVILLTVTFLIPPKYQTEIVFLDVGQGDGIYAGSQDGLRVFIDGGSTDEKQTGSYTILPFLKSRKIRQIDLWFVSHTDTDHISGLIEILKEGYPVKRVLLAEEMPADEKMEELTSAAVYAGSQVQFLNEGDCIGTEKMMFTCLGGSKNSKDKNENSMVLYMDSGNITALFTGDISSEREETIADQYVFEPVDLLKAAHHGSGSSNSAVLLKKADPEATVISCGEDNSYGHPHPEALKRMEDIHTTVLITAQSGQITVRPWKEKIAVDTFLDSEEGE